MGQRIGRLARTLLLILAVLAAAALPLLLPLQAWLVRLVEWARGAGGAGAVVYGLAYVVGTVLFVPGIVLTLGAGFLYGPLLGTLLISPASVAGSTAAFLLGRTVARRRVAARMAGSPRFRAIDEAVGRNGFKIVLLLRLSPVLPFNLLNYALALTRVRLRDYVLASLIGVLPVTVLYVWAGSLVTSVVDLASGDLERVAHGRTALLAAGLLATLAAVVITTRAAQSALRRELGSPAGEGDAAVAVPQAAGDPPPA